MSPLSVRNSARANKRQMLGAAGENIAAEYLTVEGDVIIDRNWRCRAGEVDLVVKRGHLLVFVEVRARRSSRFGHPLESITPTKIDRMRTVAFAWRDAHPEVPGKTQLDVITVQFHDEGMPLVMHIEGVGGEEMCW